MNTIDKNEKLGLINYYLERQDLHIHDGMLRLKLKCHTHDYARSFIQPLCNDTLKILSFLGYDPTIDFEKLSKKNLFVYITSSTKLNPLFINYTDSFKGPFAKTSLQKEFNEYLLSQNYKKYLYMHDNIALEEEKRKLRDDAIVYFNKQDDIDTYASQYKFFNKLFEQRAKLPTNTFFDYNKFIVLHGIKSIISMSDEELKRKWLSFSKDNWSALDIFC